MDWRTWSGEHPINATNVSALSGCRNQMLCPWHVATQLNGFRDGTLGANFSPLVFKEIQKCRFLASDRSQVFKRYLSPVFSQTSN
jgi:hypothetical protein